MIHEERDDRIGAGGLADPDQARDLARGNGPSVIQASRIHAPAAFSPLR